LECVSKYRPSTLSYGRSATLSLSVLLVLLSTRAIVSDWSSFYRWNKALRVGATPHPGSSDPIGRERCSYGCSKLKPPIFLFIQQSDPALHETSHQQMTGKMRKLLYWYLYLYRISILLHTVYIVFRGERMRKKWAVLSDASVFC